jgi:hypothetical protein
MSNSASLVAVPLPENDVGPVAVKVKSSSVALPPLSMVSCFISLRDGILSSLVITHDADSPNARVMVSASSCVPPIHIRH